MRCRQKAAFAPGDLQIEGNPDHYHSLMLPFSAGSALLYPKIKKNKKFSTGRMAKHLARERKKACRRICILRQTRFLVTL